MDHNKNGSMMLLFITKAEYYHKTSHKTDIITDSFLKIFSFFVNLDALWIVSDGTMKEITRQGST